MTPRPAPPLLLVALLGPALTGCGEPPLARSVVLITCDTLRADRVGAYGAPADMTPHLDAFARDAIVYQRAYSSASLTSPALCSLMTGRLPDELGMSTNRVVMSSGVTTIAEVVSDAGLRTHAIVSNFVLREREGDGGIEQGFTTYDDDFDAFEANRPKVKERLAGATTDAALAWLDEHADERFFLWVHYQDPHGPYVPPGDFIPPADDAAGRVLAVGRTNLGHGELPRYQVLEDERRAPVYRARYEAEIRYFDRELGRLLDGLDGHGVLEDSLVLFTADHGESLGEHDWWFSHGWTLYEDLVHVPFLLKLPPGPTSAAPPDTLVSHLDVLPTVLTALGLRVHDTHGTSLFGAGPAVDRVVPSQLREGEDRWESLTDGRYRLIRNAAGASLFDLVEDPGEQRDLSASLPEVARELERAAAAYAGRLAPVPTATEDVETVETLQQMENLGYAGEE